VTLAAHLNNVFCMLGGFLEIGIGVSQVGEALQFYRSLGFQELLTADFVTSPYAALWDGGITIGLHAGDTAPSLRFVRPRLKEHLPALRRLKLNFEATELGDDAFNRLSFLDNADHRVELVEARTYSPGSRDASAVSACGIFKEISMPTHSARESAEFWKALGFITVAESESPYPWVRLTGAGCSLGFHEARLLPGVSFESSNVRERSDFLRAQGHEVKRTRAPSFVQKQTAVISLEGSSAIYLHERA
jgi:hypothetical protein